MTQNKEPQPIQDLQKQVKEVTVKKETRNIRADVIKGYLIISLIVFFVLAFFAKQLPYFPVDIMITRTIQHNNWTWFRMLMQFVSAIGFSPYNYIWLGSIAVILFISGLRWEAITSVINAIVITLIGLGMKLIVRRPRPGDDLVNVMAHLKEYSFPSGHVLLYTAYFGFLFFLTYTILKRSPLRSFLLGAELFFILLIGPSRIFLGAHWASDTLGAYMLGSIWVLLMIYFYEWGKKTFFQTQKI